MAAPENPIAGVTAVTKIDGTLVGAQTDATLSWPTEVQETVTKNDYGWTSTLAGMEEWSLEQSGLVLNNSGEDFISNNNASLEIEADLGSGTEGWHTIQYLDSIDATFEMGMAETGGLDKALARYVRPGERSMSVEIEGSYLDPAADVGEEYNELLFNRKSSSSINTRLTLAQKEFTTQVNVGDVSFDFPAESEDATISMTLQSDGKPTEGGSDFGTGFELFLDAFFNKSSVNAAVELHDDTGSAITGSTTHTGTGYISSLSLSASHGDPAEADVTITGDGPLSNSTI